ncbi:MAG: MFS transporter [Azoarcus sp.]|jgi:MFS family permease|nr:MFS transporter [Azoarcus sp.]
MSHAELRVGLSLAAIFALRMLGLFLILPVFAVHASSIPGGDNAVFVGLAIGAYGITQAFLQIVFGAASDRYGRKPVILSGLLLFALGSVVAALAADIYTIIAGRVLQGAGAVSAAVTALAADLTRERHRAKVMAMIGSSIGLVFALSMVAAPLLYAAVGMAGIFWLTAALAAGAMALVVWVVPDAPPRRAAPRGQDGTLAAVLRHGELMRLNFGVFALHTIQAMMWVTVPAALVARGGLPLATHWKIYLPAVLLSFAVMFPAVLAAERGGRFKPVFTGAVALLALVQAGLYWLGDGPWFIGLWLSLFFVAFNIVEAIQPSWISRIVSSGARGMALGVYNTLQSVGLFLGGFAGGWLVQYYGEAGVGACCATLALLWLAAAATMKSPPTNPRAD